MSVSDTVLGVMPGAYWSPLLFLVLFVVIAAVLFVVVRFTFRNDYDSRGDQVKPFNSGNLDQINYNVQSSNLYWGFKQALSTYYRITSALHTGDLNDYIRWLTVSLALCLLLVGGGLL